MEKKKKVQNLSSVDDPLKVKVLILAQQKTSFQDFFFIRNFANVVKIDLSYNKLTSFPVGFSFKNFHQLKILFLHYNRFSAHKNLQAVCETSTIEYLTLFGNPMEQAKTRHYFLNKISSLKLMDDKLIRVEERFPQLMIEESNPTSLRIPFPIVTTVSNDLSSSFLAAVIEQLHIIKKRYLQVNPLIRIQRWFKKCVRLRRLTVSIRNSQRIQKSISQRRIKIIEERLMTQKFQNSKNQESKVISLLRMNFTFWTQIRQLMKGNIYVLRDFCVQKSINFQNLPSYYCLRITQGSLKNKQFLQFIIHSSNRYLLRKKGSDVSMHLNQQFNLYRKLKVLKDKPIDSSPNLLLSQKLQRIRQSYSDKLVQISQQDNEKIFHLIKDSYYRCIKNNEKFPFIFEGAWKRTNAAVSIQRMWKGYKARKVLNYPNFLLQKTAALKIQRWVRRLGFKNKTNFMLDSYFYIKQQSSSSLILKTSDFLRLKLILLQKLIGINFVFRQQKLLHIRYKSDGKSVCLQDKTQIYPPHFKSYLNLEEYFNDETEESDSSLILITLLLKGAINIKNDSKYVKIQYCSVQEARNRKYLLALGTYSFRTKEFIKSIDNYDNSNQLSLYERIQKQVFIGYELPMSLFNRFEKQFRAKYFKNKEDLSKTIKISIPVSFSVKIDFSSMNKVLNSQKSLIRQQSNHSSAKISKNVLSIQDKYVPNVPKPKRYEQYHDFSISIQNSESQNMNDVIRGSRTQKIRQNNDSTIISDKKEKIEFIKNSHRERVEANNSLKKNELKRLRRQLNQEEEKQQRSIKLSQIQTLMSNIKKHNLIRNKKQKNDEEFEKKFLSRGNSSIKKQMIRHEKNSKSPDHISLQSPNNTSKHILLSKPSKRYVNLKTEIKQFSLMISETDMSLGNLPIEEVVSKQKRQKRERQESSFKKDLARREENVRFNSVQAFDNEQKIENMRKKKDRKRKIVHSVFPEEFYPLKQSKKLGFELPKIGK